MANEKLCLKWNDFQDVLKSSVGELRDSIDFTDVTLVCEDQSVKAHKVILSACSPFFKRLLKSIIINNNNNKPNLFETKQDNHMIKEQKQIPSIH